jgi:hypothetical protein
MDKADNDFFNGMFYRIPSKEHFIDKQKDFHFHSIRENLHLGSHIVIGLVLWEWQHV